MTALAALVVALLAILRPALEQLPWAHADSPFHDLTLQLANVALNLGGLLLFGTASGQLQLTSGQQWALMVVAALVQAFGGHAGYNTIKTAVVTSQAAQGIPAPAKVEAPIVAPAADWPPVAPVAVGGDSGATTPDTAAA
jgi:hypothetical protein